MEAEPWDRAEDLFIRQRLKERRSPAPEDIATRMRSLGYRRTTEEVVKRCRHVRAVLAAEAKALREAAQRKEDGDPLDLRRQNQAFLKAMMSADLD